MRTKPCFTAALLLSLAAGRAHAVDITDSKEWFERGLHYDLGLGEDSARLAFDAFRKAADTGMSEAEFNVAVMLDSGRGVEQDVAMAATWYARSASHGNKRAAYNLGQLYENGEGVPRNRDIAAAWYAFSDLPAAREHLAAAPAHSSSADRLSPPLPVSPRAGEVSVVRPGGIELVWTTMPQPEAVSFYIEVRAIQTPGRLGWQEVFASSTTVTSVVVDDLTRPGLYLWRVSAIAPRLRRYEMSSWQSFRVEASPVTASSSPR